MSAKLSTSRMLNLLILIFLLLFTTDNFSTVNCDRNDFVTSDSHRIGKRVVGGCKTEKYCFTVFHLDLNPGYCTGTFIAPNAILTAAHCCNNNTLTDIKIQNKDRNKKVTVLECHIHPDYKGYVSNDDIAIIELKESFEWVETATLNYSGVKMGETVWLYGYGWIDENATTQAAGNNEIRATVITGAISDGYERPKNWTKYGNVTVSNGQNGASCKGDSGGPMFNKNATVVGLMSGFSKEINATVSCPLAQIIFHVSIASQREFIQQTLDKLASNVASSRIGLNPNLVTFAFSILIQLRHIRVVLE